MKNGHGSSGYATAFTQFLTRLPHFCCFCHQKTHSEQDLCRYCFRHLPKIVQFGSESSSALCLRCGMLCDVADVLQNCANCVNYQTLIRYIVSAFRYDFPIDAMIGRLKYHQHLPTGRLLGSLLADAVSSSVFKNDYPDCVLPVPLNSHRYRQRGFNHSQEIAQSCAAHLGLPCLTRAVGRHFDTGSLAELTRAERGLQIRGAFWASDQLRGARVAIVDDVLTTGATCGELATELSDSGVSDIQVWVVARTPLAGNTVSS